ncbi:unnamed protein product [Dibothriocephalus latus]|uniref:Uncharacterized protein n=1 Tax=Dibothriocephalus latus TaxID=60516 RepID=A0A3P7RD40_DIBLA|nr:unnamed protein product [Dibothriocephalus latus]
MDKEEDISSTGCGARHEFSSAKDFNADSIVCLYHVNLSVLARMLIEYSQHALLRLDIRSEAELKEKR